MQKKRLLPLQNKLKEFHLDALLITSQPNIFYLTGIPTLPDTKELAAILTRKELFVFANSTYFVEARHQIRAGKLLALTPQMRLSHHLAQISRQESLKRLGFEASDVTVAQLQALKKALPSIRFVDSGNLIAQLRHIKDDTEIAAIKKAAKITDQAFAFILKSIKRGVREKDLALQLEVYLKKHADGIAFSPIVASGVGSASPHYISSEKVIQMGEMVLLDFGAKVDGYFSDLTRTVFVGKATEKFKEIYQTVLEAQNQALEYLRRHLGGGRLNPPAGGGSHDSPEVLGTGSNLEIPTKAVDSIARDYIKTHGYPDIPHGLGHSLGLEIHESPRLSPTDNTIIKPGMVFTIEPGIYLPNWGGVRIEELVYLGEKGIEVLSKSPRELIGLEAY